MGNADTQLKQRKKKSSSAKHKMKKREKKIPAAERKRRRRRARRRIVVLEWALIACVVFVLIGAGGYVVWNLPSLKLSRELNAGMEYTQEEAYDAAIEPYENALKIDSTSVEAYRCMAGAYINMQEDSQAKQILFDGWENTQDEGLLEYYCTVILNEAVAEINSDAVNAGTIEKIADVLERHALKEEAVELLGTACSRWMDAADITEFDFSSYEQAGFSFRYCRFGEYAGDYFRVWMAGGGRIESAYGICGFLSVYLGKRQYLDGNAGEKRDDSLPS